MVEVRSLPARLNSCGCHDHRVNGLGTCKHIEGVLEELRRRPPRVLRQIAREGSRRVEIFLCRDGAPAVQVSWAQPEDEGVAAVRALLASYLAEDGRALAGPGSALAALRAALAGVEPALRARVVCDTRRSSIPPAGSAPSSRNWNGCWSILRAGDAMPQR